MSDEDNNDLTNALERIGSLERDFGLLQQQMDQLEADRETLAQHVRNAAENVSTLLTTYTTTSQTVGRLEESLRSLKQLVDRKVSALPDRHVENCPHCHRKAGPGQASCGFCGRLLHSK